MKHFYGYNHFLSWVNKMPLTPLHLGPALLLGFIFRKRLDIIALALGSVILDIECVYKILIGDRLLHAGFFHSFIGAIIAGIILGLVLYLFDNKIYRFKHWLKIDQKTSFSMIISGSVIGTVSHVFLDAFLYPEMRPFYPLSINPLYNHSIIIIAHVLVYAFCLLCFIPTAYVYVRSPHAQ